MIRKKFLKNVEKIVWTWVVFFTSQFRFEFVKFSNLRVQVRFGSVKIQGFGFGSGSVLDQNPNSSYKVRI